MKKLILWLGIFIINLQIALAQTGLFSSEGAGNFARTGITFIILVVIARTLFKDLVKRIRGK